MAQVLEKMRTVFSLILDVHKRLRSFLFYEKRLDYHLLVQNKNAKIIIYLFIYT